MSVAVTAALVLAAAGPLSAWNAGAHAKIAASAVSALPEEVPEFFRSGLREVGRSAIDPDYYRLRDLPQLRDAETPAHYLDSELLRGATWPERRSEYLLLLARLELTTIQAGTLPYSVLEGMQKLAAAFAQHRLDPEDAWARQRVLYLAGVLAHYSADLCQPLHTTVHYNGRTLPDGSSPHTGIHQHADALATHLYRLGEVPEVAAVTVRAHAKPRRAIEEAFAESHALVPRVYELEPALALEEGQEDLPAPVLAFARERIEASIRLTADLFLSAWRLSAGLDLPSWYLEIEEAQGSAAAEEEPSASE